MCEHVSGTVLPSKSPVSNAHVILGESDGGSEEVAVVRIVGTRDVVEDLIAHFIGASLVELPVDVE